MGKKILKYAGPLLLLLYFITLVLHISTISTSGISEPTVKLPKYLHPVQTPMTPRF